MRIQPGGALKTERIGVAPQMAGQMPVVVVSGGWGGCRLAQRGGGGPPPPTTSPLFPPFISRHRSPSGLRESGPLSAPIISCGWRRCRPAQKGDGLPPPSTTSPPFPLLIFRHYRSGVYSATPSRRATFFPFFLLISCPAHRLLIHLFRSLLVAQGCRPGGRGWATARS